MKVIPPLLLLCLLLAGSFAPSSPARAKPSEPCDRPFQHVSLPLNDLGSEPYIRMDGEDTGEVGGLYPGGTNQRPKAHTRLGVQEAAQIVPLNRAGEPDPQNGKIALISVGMSNTAMEFRTFMETLEGDPQLNPKLVLVNGAQPGMVAPEWVDPDAPTWHYVDYKLDVAGLTPAQAQVAWVKLTRVGSGPFPEWARSLEGDLIAVARNLKARYPNLRLAYFSSRIYSYTYWQGLSPEPTAFEGAFSVRWLIEKQLQGDPRLNFRPSDGPVTAPWLSWGPYLWADGTNPRSDGLVWLHEDLVVDCTHPSDSGTVKVAEMMIRFFKSDPTARTWFLKPDAGPPLPTASPGPVPAARRGR